MLQKLVCIILLLTFSIRDYVNAQSSADSSFEDIKKLDDDSVKIQKLFNLGYTLEETNETLCDKVYDEAIHISQKINNTSLECKSLINKGILKKTHAEYESANSYYQQAYQLALKTNDLENTGKALSNIGNIYMVRLNYEAALKKYLEAINYFDKTNNQRTLSLTYGNIGNIFQNQYLYKEAIEYHQKAINAALLCKDDRTIGLAYLNISVAYANKKDSSKNFQACLKALEYLRKGTFKTSVQQVYQNIASYYLGIKDFSKANIYADSALQIATTLNNTTLITKTLLLKSMIERETHNAMTAEKMLQKAKINIPTSSAEDSILLLKYWNLEKSRVEEAKGHPEIALEYYKKYHSYEDSMKNETIRTNTISLEKKFESEKKGIMIDRLEKEKKIQQLSIQKKNTWLYILLGTIISISLITFLVISSNRQKQIIQTKKIKELEQEKQLVAVNSIIQGQETERSRMAKDLHDGVGGMLSGIKLNLSSMKGNMIIQEKDAALFAKSITQLDNAIAEMRRVAHNMMPEALMKFGLNEAVQDFCDGINESNAVKMKYMQIGLQQPLEKSMEVILYRIVQELCNNAIKHAAAANIFIQLNRHERGISLTVEDDGKGFDVAQLETIKGAGLQNVQSRVDYLKGSFHVQSEIKKGTSVSVDVPL